MRGKFVFFGEGVKVPGTDFGFAVAAFKVWLCLTGGQFKGYTTASNQGLLGYALIETPVVEFVMRDLESEEPFMNLHGSSVDLTISPTTFVRDGGTATLKMIIRTNDTGTPNELTFFSDACKGVSASLSDIHFVATLVELPANEWDAPKLSYVPW